MKENKNEAGIKFCELLSVNIATGTREELFSSVASLHGVGGAVYTTNPEILALSYDNPELRLALREGLNIPDGVGVRRALGLRGIVTETYPGVELGEALLTLDGVRLGILGGKRGVAEEAMRRLLIKHPGIFTAFSLDGYTYTEESVYEVIKATAPTVVFVCLGSPRQELFISRAKDKFPSVLFIALGGSADVYAGRVLRAPKIFRRAGLEWLFRIIISPKRILRVPRLARFCVYDIKSKHGGEPICPKKLKKRRFF